jgi:hypothetical protein
MGAMREGTQLASRTCASLCKEFAYFRFKALYLISAMGECASIATGTSALFLEEFT